MKDLEFDNADDAVRWLGDHIHKMKNSVCTVCNKTREQILDKSIEK